MATVSHEITELVFAWSQGDQAALDRLIPLVYEELRRLAQREMCREYANHTLQATALINEAYVRLVKTNGIQCENRTHFLAIYARLMRRILVDFARSRQELKRGGGRQRVELSDGLQLASEQSRDLTALDDALTAFASVDPRRSHVVELRFFGGLSIQETADVLKVSTETVKRDWRISKVWLLRELTKRIDNDA